MKKKYVLILLFVIIIITVCIIAKMTNNTEEKPKLNNNTEPNNGVEPNEEFKIYSTENIKINNSGANLIFLENLDGIGQEELNVKVGDTYSFNKYGNHTIKVLELTQDYITISANGLAPTKNTGGFSLIDNYEKITIQKNTGICLNVQETDLFDGFVYFFYVN